MNETNAPLPPDLLSERAAPFFLEGGPHAILLIHGFTGSPAHMLPLGEALHTAGLTVQGIRLRGHGTTVEAMNQATWEDWWQDAQTAYRTLRGQYRTVSVGGLSMGGVLSLLLAATHPEAACCVSLSAPMGMANPVGRAGHLIAPFLPYVTKKPDPARALLDAGYDIGYDVIPVARTHDLDILIQRARRQLGDIRCPLLVAQSESDRAITPDSADVIMKGVSSAVRERVTLQTSPHVITIGPEKDRLFEAVIRFVTRFGRQEGAAHEGAS